MRSSSYVSSTGNLYLEGSCTVHYSAGTEGHPNDVSRKVGKEDICYGKAEPAPVLRQSSRGIYNERIFIIHLADEAIIEKTEVGVGLDGVKGAHRVDTFGGEPIFRPSFATVPPWGHSDPQVAAVFRYGWN